VSEKTKPGPKPYVIAQCVMCKSERKVYAHEVRPGDLPECEKCYSPMVAKRAAIRRSTR
jgi:hypothetical protein